METQFQHQTVLLNEAVEQLKVSSGGVYIDATFGRGGHSTRIRESLKDSGQLIIMDRDPEAIQYAEQIFSMDERVSIIHKAFSALQETINGMGLNGKVDGVLFDLGVSSPQLDDPQRGFSFMRPGVLDMRMNPSQGVSAQEWINSVSEREMAEVFKQFGEERYSKRIAKAIIQSREQQLISDTLQLAEIIKQAHPRWEKHKHPATRCFQAIRIELNQELQEVSQTLQQVVQVLKKGGRLVVISFHSLEDRLVKKFILQQSQSKQYPKELPIRAEEFAANFKKIGKAIKASKSEVESNPRARSAIMRVAEKL